MEKAVAFHGNSIQVCPQLLQILLGVLSGTRHTTNTETELNQEVSKKFYFRTAKYQKKTKCHIQKNDGINQATAMKAEQGKE